MHNYYVSFLILIISVVGITVVVDVEFLRSYHQLRGNDKRRSIPFTVRSHNKIKVQKIEPIIAMN